MLIAPQRLTSRVKFGAPIEKPKSTVGSMGVHAHAYRAKDAFDPLVDETDLDQIQYAGIKVVRSDCLWGAVEKSPGVYDFSKYDRWVEALIARGLKPMMILGLGNGEIHGGPAGLTINHAGIRKGFNNYAKAAVSHFKGKGVIWELIQQPNHEFFWQPKPDATAYAKLANELLPELKKLDPSASFVAPSIAGHDLAYQESVYKSGLLEHVDAVSVHPFRGVSRMPESIETNYKKSQALVKQYAPKGKDIPVLLGEWGYNSVEIDQQTQANYAQRQMLMGMMLGAPVNIWFNWKGDIMNQTDDPNNPEQQYGLVRATTRETKPSYAALHTLYRALAGQHFIERLPSTPNDYLLRFKGPNKQTLVAWTCGQSHVIPAPKGVQTGTVQLTLTGKPAFLDLG
ncbi:MAG: cellulase family glycosylhydrolase [Vampirovibrionales bacterium]|nr:cellulase family glycosylhydrolase [Vampirovibrionales bacterium]